MRRLDGAERDDDRHGAGLGKVVRSELSMICMRRDVPFAFLVTFFGLLSGVPAVAQGAAATAMSLGTECEDIVGRSDSDGICLAVERGYCLDQMHRRRFREVRTLPLDDVVRQKVVRNMLHVDKMNQRRAIELIHDEQLLCEGNAFVRGIYLAFHHGPASIEDGKDVVRRQATPWLAERYADGELEAIDLINFIERISLIEGSDD